MTEAEWLACPRPNLMLGAIGDKVTDRKLRLFACGCCARIQALITDAHAQSALFAAEEYAEGRLTAEQLEEASYAAHIAAEEMWSFTHEAERRVAITRGTLRETDETFGIWEYASAVAAPIRAASYATYPTDDNLLWAIEQMVSCVVVTAGHVAEPMLAENFDLEHQEAIMRAERAELESRLRCVVGNHYSPVTFSQEWRTDTTGALATQMYSSRDFSAMPILADALQDAGCDNEDILVHCRDPKQVHVRGCWVVDLMLGKQ